MKITAIAPWFGSKRTLAPTIIEEIGPHHAYWEPFCGSMAVLLAKPVCRMETVNDLHGDLVNLARMVKDRSRGPELYRRLRRVLSVQDFIADSREEISAASDCPVSRAEAYFVNSWQSMNGTAGSVNVTKKSGVARRFSSKGGTAPVRFAAAVSSIPAWRRRMRGVMILSADGIELCEKIEDEHGVVIYADPPYLTKGAKYQHDFDWLAHRRLANALRRFKKTRVVVSYYDHFDLTAMYPDWLKRPVHVTKTLVNQGRRDSGGATVAPEVLLINGPSYAAGAA